MFSLVSLGDLLRFQCSNFKNEVYLITEDVRIKSNGILLAARSAKIEKMLKKSESIPAMQFSDNVAGLEDCLDLVYGRSVEIRESNFNTIYKFGKLFQIREMMEGMLVWIANDVTYDEFWKIYLKNLHEDTSVFVGTIKGYWSTYGDHFIEHATEICRDRDINAIAAVVESLSRIDDIGILTIMEDLIDAVMENNKSQTAAAPYTDRNNYLQRVISSTVTFIENYLETHCCDEFNKARCRQTLKKAKNICASNKTLRMNRRISFYAHIQ